MFKRVERKRKRREEEEELGLDEDAKQMIGLNDTDSDESDSGSEQEGPDSRSDLDLHPSIRVSVDGDQLDEDAMSHSEGEGVNEDPPISVEEALKDPIYLISLDPTAYGCVLCKRKLIKNAGMATAHKNANTHKRRFEQFRLLSAGTDLQSNVWELVRTNRSVSDVQKVDSQEPSKRALKRQAKQATIRKKRIRHKEIRAKVIAKKALKKPLTPEGTRPAAPSKTNSPESQNQPEKSRKKQKLESATRKVRDVTAASRTRTSSDGKKSVVKSRIKSTKKPT